MNKKCKWCGKEEDFVESPTCDKCAVELYCKLYKKKVLELIKDKELITKIKNIKI